MPRKIAFYASEDDLSNKLIKILNGLISEIKSTAKISSKDMWPAFAETTVKILLPSTLGVKEELECEIWTSPKDYEEVLKTKFGLAGIPAVKIGDNIFVGESAIGVASDLHTLLTSNKYATAEQILYHLAATAKSLAETQMKETEKEIELTEAAVTSVLRQTISEKLSSLEKLYREKKIDEEPIRKMRKTYEELLGRT
jgi:hypothetical protein